MTAVEKLIKTAESQIGYLEKATNSNLEDFTANAGRGNWNKYANYFDTKYPTFYNGKKNGYDWCDIFVDWCFITTFGFDTGRKMLYQPLKSCGAGCSWSKKYYQDNNRIYTTPIVGDQVFYGTSHTGIVVKVEGDKFYTVEGNTSAGNTVIANGGGVAYKGPYAVGGNKTFGRPNWDLVGGYSYTAPKAYIMSYGQTSNDIKYLQQNLNGLGYPCDTPDGHYGPKTKSMVEKFQKDYSLKVSGNVDEATWKKIKELVKKLQEDLNKLGYDCSTPDGIVGPKTVASITKFQKDHKMEADGMAGPITRNAIAKAIEDKNKPTIHMMVKGSKGDDVKKLQEKLNKLGFMCDAPDGNFGPKTLQAVNNFQDATFGNHDGEVGPKTMAKIDSWVAKIYKAKVNSSNGLNIRKSFSLSSSKVGSLANGKDIKISVIKNDFGKLAGRDGWVMLKWTKKV